MMPAATSGEQQASGQPGQGFPMRLEIPSDPAEALRVQGAIEQALAAIQYSEHDIFGIKLALEEALINAIKHGNQMDRTKKVQVAYRIRAERFDVVITDEGSGFNLADVPDPTAIENLERPCGRGLMLMRHYMTEVAFLGRGNIVQMSKLRLAESNGRP